MKLAVFDIDGTLVDSRAMITASLSAAFEEEGLSPPPVADMLSIVGLSLVEAMRVLAPGAPAVRHESLAAAYKRAFWRLRQAGEHEELLFPGAHRALDDLRLRDDMLLGIATGKSRRGVAHLIDRHGFDGWFATVQTADAHPSKPHPAMVIAALAETGVDPWNAVVIGDTSYDMEMARAAGAHAVGVAWGNHAPDRLALAGAHHILRGFNELHAVLQRLWQDRAA